MKKIFASLSITLLMCGGFALVSMSTPLQAGAANLIPCNGVAAPGATTVNLDKSNPDRPCTFDDVITLIANIIDFLIFVLAPVMAGLLLLYAGFLILTSAGSTEKMSEAKGIFSKAIMGLVVAMCAWLIVKAILVGLGYDTQLFPAFYS